MNLQEKGYEIIRIELLPFQADVVHDYTCLEQGNGDSNICCMLWGLASLGLTVCCPASVVTPQLFQRLDFAQAFLQHRHLLPGILELATILLEDLCRGIGDEFLI